MRTLILTFATIMMVPFTAMSEPRLSQPPSMELITAEAPIFGIGKPKYNKNKIDRINSVGNKNRRTKRINRKFGIGQVTGNRIDHAA